MQEQDANLVKRCVNGILSNFDYQKKELNPRWLKDLKVVVRKNESIVESFVDKLFEELHKEDCDRRMGSMLIADYFFQRSHKFRLELVEHIQDLMIFSIETDPLHYPLPAPPDAAASLKKESLKIIKAWIDKFAKGYTKLNTAVQFLTECKHFDFRQANEQLLVERRRAEEERLRKQEHARKIAEKVQQLFDDSKLDIDRTLAECRNSMRLIFPDIFREEGDDDAAADAPSTSAAPQNLSRDREKLHGYKGTENLTINIDSARIDIEANQDNSALVDALKDAQILLNKYMKSVKKWLKNLVQAGTVENAELVRTLVRYKAQIAHELERSEQLKIKNTKKRRQGASDSDESGDSDFEDVVKEGLELEVTEPDLLADSDEIPASVFQRIEEMERRDREKAAKSGGDDEDADRPGPSGWRPDGQGTSSSMPQDSSLFANGGEIPKLAYGLDLKYWGQDVEPAMIPRNEFDGHPFWRASDPGDTVTKEVEDVYRTRQMTYVGERPVIKHQCRAPLPSGKLCPRMDLENCPFHGPIVPRDEMGFPIAELGKGAVEHMKMAEERMKKRIEQDEQEYLRDVEAAVGVSLGAADKSKRTRMQKNKAYGTARKREKTQTELSRERLEKKLFNRSALKRVGETLTSIQQKRANQNFSSQFNYAITRR